MKVDHLVTDRAFSVDYIDHMGSDITVVNAARVSFGNTKTDLDDRDKKLINYLAKHRHMTPFEHCSLTLKIKCPLYIRTQIMRHRTFSYNEISRRYTSKDMEFYVPPQDDMRAQSTDNKQCSEGNVDAFHTTACDHIFKHSYDTAFRAYEKLLELGLSREQARGVLPQNVMTEFYMSGNLRNWAHFLGLRLGKDAQSEVRNLSVEVNKIIMELFPVAGHALKENL